MLIYNSMIVWIGIVGLFYNFKKSRSVKLATTGAKEIVPMFIAILTFGYIIFWAGIRSGVADTATYIMMFKNCHTGLSAIFNVLGSDSKAVGFNLLSVLFKTLISDNYHVWLMSIAILTGATIMLTLRKYSENFLYSAFLFVVSLNFFWMLNGIRQFLVAGILFVLSDWIMERKTVRFIIAVLLLSTVHFTAIITIPVYFFVTEKPFGKKMILFVCLIVVCLFFLSPFLDTLDYLLTDSGYGGFQEQFSQDDGVHPIRVLVALVPTVIAFINRRTIKKKNNPYINLCINMSMVSAGIYFIGIFTSGILVGRLPIYFELYNLILLPYLIRNCFSKGNSRLVYLCTSILYFAFYYVQMSSSYYISDITGLV